MFAENNLFRDTLLFVGTGQCGGNIAKNFYELGYFAYFINSSLEDLNTLNVSRDLLFHIPTATGCSKNIKKAKEYGKLYHDRIISQITTKFSNIKYAFFCFSAGGGTGNGMSPILMQSLKNKMSDIKIGALVALPGKDDSLQAKHNAIQCVKTLSDLLDAGTLKNIYFLNNDAGDIMEVNQNATNRLARLFSITTENYRGLIDNSEIENVFSIPGCVNVCDIVVNDTNKQLDNLQNENIQLYPDKFICHSPKGCVKLVYSIRDENCFAKNEIQELYGVPVDFFKGYTDDFSIAYAFGMQLPYNKLQELETELLNDKNKIHSNSKFSYKLSEDIAGLETQSYDIDNTIDVLESLF